MNDRMSIGRSSQSSSWVNTSQRLAFFLRRIGFRVGRVGHGSLLSERQEGIPETLNTFPIGLHPLMIGSTKGRVTRLCDTPVGDTPSIVHY